MIGFVGHKSRIEEKHSHGQRRMEYMNWVKSVLNEIST